MSSLVAARRLIDELGSGERPLVLDARFSLVAPGQKEEDYQTAHIPGALYVHLERDLSARVVPGTTGRHPLPAAEEFAKVVARLGIEPSTKIVVYDDAGGAFAARLWWMLRATGHEHVRVLDGGFPAYVAAAGPIESGARVSVPAPVRELAFERRWIASLAEVEELSCLASGRLFDARAADRFAGENETIDKIPGHIPGARSLPFGENLREGKFRSSDELRQRFLEAFGEIGPSEVVVYCGSGVTACHDLLALEEAGLSGARLFPGSYSEWIATGERPVER